MKQLLIASFALILAVGINAQDKKVSDVAKFASDVVDMGKVKQNSPMTGTFTITNISSEPLIIEAVTPGCGCTKSDYTKEPIAPGKTGTITATYNAAAVGNFHKSIQVKFAGVSEAKSISIVGQVLDAKTYDETVKKGKSDKDDSK